MRPLGRSFHSRDAAAVNERSLRLVRLMVGWSMVGQLDELWPNGGSNDILAKLG